MEKRSTRSPGMSGSTGTRTFPAEGRSAIPHCTMSFRAPASRATRHSRRRKRDGWFSKRSATASLNSPRSSKPSSTILVRLKTAIRGADRHVRLQPCHCVAGMSRADTGCPYERGRRSKKQLHPQELKSRLRGVIAFTPTPFTAGRSRPDLDGLARQVDFLCRAAPTSSSSAAGSASSSRLTIDEYRDCIRVGGRSAAQANTSPGRDRAQHPDRLRARGVRGERSVPTG